MSLPLPLFNPDFGPRSLVFLQLLARDRDRTPCMSSPLPTFPTTKEGGSRICTTDLGFQTLAWEFPLFNLPLFWMLRIENDLTSTPVGPARGSTFDSCLGGFELTSTLFTEHTPQTSRMSVAKVFLEPLSSRPS